METITILLRVAMTFGVLLLFTRLAGKKQIAQITFFDFITAVAIGDIAAEQLSNPEEPLLPWLAGTLLWFGLAIGLDLLVLRSRRVAKLVEGEPTVIMENGRILEKKLRANFLRVDDLMATLRAQGYFNPADVEFAVFETDGSISILPRSQKRPVTPADLNLPTQYEGMSRELVVDGRIVQANMAAMELSHAWLHQELDRKGYRVEDVFYAAIDTAGDLFVDGYNDPIPGVRVDVRDYLGPH